MTKRPLVLPHGLKQFVGFGGTGVFLFFVISGFSLALTMPRHVATGRPLFSYAMSRVFRIAPLFYVVLGYMTLRSVAHGWGFPVRTTALNASFLFNLVPGQQEGIVGASWTIGVEMLFYAAFPFIYALRLPWQVAVLAASQLLFAAMLRWLPMTYCHWSVIGWLPLFFIGIWSFSLLRRLGGSGEDKRRLGLLAMAAGTILLVACAVPEGGSGTVAFRLPIAIGYAALLIGLGVQAPGTLGARTLRFLGRISYSTYLLHAAFLIALDDWLVAATTGWADTPTYALRVAVVVALVVPSAWLANIVIEQPMERLGRSLVDRLSEGAHGPNRGQAITTG